MTQPIKCSFLYLSLSMVSLIGYVLLSGCTPFKIIVLKDPLTPEEHLNLGVAYERQGEFDHAIREYLLASKKLPIADLYLGNAHFQKNDFPKAEKYYKKAIQREPKNADAHNNLAWLYYLLGQHLDEAEQLALKAIELNPAKEEMYQDTLKKIRALQSTRQK